MISYAPLFETMARKEITSYRLIHKLGFSQTKYYRIKKSQPVTTDTLNELCELLECELHEVVCYVSNEQEVSSK